MYRTLTVAMIVLVSSTAAASGFSHDVSQHPPIPADMLEAQWGTSVVTELWRGSQHLRQEHSSARFAYPGQRDVYDNVEMGDMDITRIDADVYVDLDDKSGAIKVEARMTIVPLVDDLEEIEFYLELPEVLEISSEPDIGVTYDKVGGIITVIFPQAPALEEEVVVKFVYQGVMDCEVKFMLPTCKLEGPWKYITHSQFLPYFGYSDEVVSGFMRLFVYGKDYEKYTAGGTGTFVGSKLHPEGVKEIVFEHVFPTSLYAFSLNKFTKVHTMWEDVPISSTVQGGQLDTQGNILGLVQDILGYYSEIYVRYPWNNLDVIAMPKSFGGGFGPLSSIFIIKNTLDATWENNSIYGAMQLLSHEIGHEWWGNLVEMADSSAVMLSEGAAEFSSNLYYEHATGSRWPSFSNNMAYVFTVPYDQEPVMISPFVGSSPYYYQIAYQKGAIVFDMLRVELGEELMLAGMKAMSEEFYMKYATPADLFKVLSATTGVDLDYYYAQWVADKGHIVAKITSYCPPSAAKCELRVKQEAVGDYPKYFSFNLPVQVELRDGPTYRGDIRIEGGDTLLELPVEPANVQRIWVDSARRLARIWLPGLAGDIDLNGVVDGADLVEMSFAYQSNIIVLSDWGEHFFANPYYNELADVVTNDGDFTLDGRINEGDLDILLHQIGANSGNGEGDE